MAADVATLPLTLVWIDAREAVIVRLRREGARLVRVTSDVPARHRATGHVRHDPAVRHGGGDRPLGAGEPRRLEHLRRFVNEVGARLTADGDLLVLGRGTVRDRLVRALQESDRHHGRARTVTCQGAGRLTDRQLVARLYRAMGVDPRRYTVGAYRWSESPTQRRPAGKRPANVALPRRVVEKPPRHED
jgi:hypothetical protein